MAWLVCMVCNATAANLIGSYAVGFWLELAKSVANGLIENKKGQRPCHRRGIGDGQEKGAGFGVVRRGLGETESSIRLAVDDIAYGGLCDAVALAQDAI